LLDQLTRIANNPKSLDAIIQGDQVNPAEQPQQQAQASELEQQLKKRVQDLNAENEGLKALLEQRDAAHAAEISTMQALQKDTDNSHRKELKDIKMKYDAEIAKLKAQINNLASEQQVAHIPLQVPASINKILKTRRTDHILDNKIHKPNRIFPTEDQLSYDN